VGFDGVKEVVGVVFVGVEDSKVINNKGEGNGSGVVAPKARGGGD
jgi:hypothetical protein